MQKWTAVVWVAIGLAGCGGVDPTEPTAGTQNLTEFEATFDVESGTVSFLYAAPSVAGLQTESMNIPYGTTPGNAYIHTRQTAWRPGCTVTAGAIPNTFQAGTSAYNLTGALITNFTMVINSITPSNVGMTNTIARGGQVCAPGLNAVCPTGAAVGGGTGLANWNCTGGGAMSLASPGKPPCTLNYGPVASSAIGDTTKCDSSAADTSPARAPWFFVNPTTGNFTVRGTIMGN
jgi:hypothetical protein